MCERMRVTLANHLCVVVVVVVVVAFFVLVVLKSSLKIRHVYTS